MSFLSCQSLKSNIDRRGLADYARSLEHQLQLQRPTVSVHDDKEDSPIVHALLDFQNILHADLKDRAMMKPIVRQSLQRWKLSVPQQTIIGERLIFSAPERSSLGPSYFYYFHPENSQPAKAILWAPGFGVSDLAFFFIQRFFRIGLESGWAVLVWVPPFHLERQLPGKKSGEGLITPDLDALVDNMAASVQELQQGLFWLRQQGYQRIGAWGGSLGAANLLLLAQETELDHLAVMIPLLDWNTIWASKNSRRPNAVSDRRLRPAYTFKHYQLVCKPSRRSVGRFSAGTAF